MYKKGASFACIISLVAGLLLCLSGCALFNQPPIASFDVMPEVGDAPLEVSVDASGSYDDEGIVRYEWDFDTPDGECTTYGPTASYTYTQPGTYSITVTVFDQYGDCDMTYRYVTVEDPPLFANGDYVLWSYGWKTAERRAGIVTDVGDASALIQFYRNAHESTAPNQWIAFNELSRVPSKQRSWIQSVIPNYYWAGPFYRVKNTVSELEDFLNGGFQQIRTYLIDYYDCSNMSAYLEWALENEGFDARIVYGPTPFYSPESSHHAWVLVSLPGDDCSAAVEATHPAFEPKWAPGIIYGGDANEHGYYRGYTEVYQDIYSAMACMHADWGNEYGWWNIRSSSAELSTEPIRVVVRRLDNVPVGW